MNAVQALTPELAAELWAAVLGAGHLGVDDDLAEYGPDSLDTARVVARIRQSCGLDAPFRLVFEAATPRELATVLCERAPVRLPVPGLTSPAEQLSLWPLSHDQQRLWLLEQKGEGGGAYHVRLVLRLRGELDAAALGRAWADVVARHGSLRTRFVLDGHQPRQEVLAAGPAVLEPVDATGVPLPALLQRVADLAEPTFDLAAAPPWRVALYRLGAGDHVLAFVIHHILFDGWSQEVLRRELSELYAAHRAGRAPTLAPLTVQYTDHAAWQHALPAEAYAADLDYWRRQLAGAHPLELPTDRPRPAGWSGDGAGHTFTIESDIADGVRALARASGVTPFMALLAAWTALLGRLCDVDDVVVGASTAERDRPELEQLIGMFVNVLVIRAAVDGRQPFTELLAAVRETTLDAFAHRELPFGRLVAELAPDRHAAHNPLFNVNFVYLNQPAADEQWPQLQVQPLALDTRTTAFDVILAVQDEPDGTLRCYLEYSTALFDEDTVRRIGGYYARLLAGVVAEPAAPLGSVPILGDDERRELLQQPSAVRITEGCLPDLVRDWAGRTPAAVAVACGDRQLSYTDLHVQSNRLAHHLREHGVGPETAVAIRLPRSADQVVAMVAVWKAGGFFVPLDDEHPAERIAMMLADAEPLVLITRGATRAAAGEDAGAAKVVCLERDAADIAGQPAGEPVGVAADPDTLAAAIYTSGSTGRPKAVALTHRNVLSAQVGREEFDAPPRAMLLPVSFAFDVFLTFTAWTLREGGRVVVPVQPRGADLDELAALLITHRVSHLVAPPDLQRALLARQDVRAGNQLALGVVGGQSCPRALAEDYALHTDGGRLVNEYSATETSAGTHHVSALDAESAQNRQHARGQLPIGRAATNSLVYLLDADLQPVPVGVAGELYLGGPGLARGYLGRRDLTADRFLPDPFGEPGQRLYRTGDLARLRADGELEFLGRRDRQVKVRGHRIELAEIEAALITHDLVADAAVVLAAQRPELVAFTTAAGANGATPEAATAEQLRAHLQRLLPEPWVPSAFVTLPALPLTPNGKVDRTALAELDVAALQAATETAPRRTLPRTPTEVAVAQLWAEVLEIGPELDVHTDFFTLGGHSLLAANVVSRLRTRFPVRLGMQDLFAEPTVAGLAELIDARTPAPEPEPAPAPPAAAAAEIEAQPVVQLPALDATAPDAAVHAAGTGQETITRVDAEGPAPLSAGQLQLWLADRRAGTRAYQVPLALRLVGALNLPALRAALDGLVARHEVLRTRIELVGDQPVQLVDPPRPVRLPVVRHTRGELDELLESMVAEPFDLAADLMLRAALVRLSDSEHILLLVLHHIAGDGASMDILVQELAHGYASRAVPQPALRYTDYARWYHERAASQEHQTQLDYWRQQLAGLVPLRLPADRPAPVEPDPDGRRVRLHLDSQTAAAVRALAERSAATPFMVLLTALKALLVRIGAGSDVAVGVPVSGRGRAELRGLVGYFGNLIVLRTQLAGELNFAAALDQVRASTVDGLARQEVAFASVVSALSRQRGRFAELPFGIAFSYESVPAPLPAIGELAATRLAPPVRVAQFELALRLTDQVDGSVLGEFEYATARYDEATAQRLSAQFVRLLGAVLHDPQAPLESVSLLDAEDERQLALWNDTGREHPPATLASLLAGQVARTPDAPAVWADGSWASYAEFGAGVNRLAHHLRAAGVGVDDVVGVCLPRGAQLVTALHAVVAAGAGYLPLPPDLPPARLAAMIEDAAPAAVITTDELADAVRAAGAHTVVCLDTERDQIAARPHTPVDVDLPPDALAYVIFTSGSTGRPKGVAVSHRSVVNWLLWMQRAIGLDPADRLLLKTPFSFDVSVRELFWPLITGAGLVVVGDGDHRDFGQLAEVAAETGATMAHFVPSILALFLDEPQVAGRLTSLRRVLCSGEALPPALVDRLHAVLPGVQLHNLYGPTETAVEVSWQRCHPGQPTVPIGAPVDNTRLEVLDANGDRVPVGVPGELCVGGVQLARGYVGRPDLTAQRFVPDPYAAQPGGRLYRTGDLARWRRDGTVEYLGRLDHQVKIRGVRIEPAEVEAALRQHPEVADAVVLAWQPPGTDARLVAYVVPRAQPPVTAQLRTFLRGQLPAAMVPSRFVIIDSFPLTPSGKLDRRALPSPDAAPVADELVWLRRGPDPLFCVHPGDGSAQWYAPLAQVLDQPVAALRWPIRGAGSVEQVAARYLAALRGARPCGPYRLLGWCGGAAVTWELACQLADAGEQVRLWLLDPLVDVAQRPVSARQLELFRQSERLFTELDSEPDQAAAAARRADIVEYLRQSIEDPGLLVTEEDVRNRVRASRELLQASIDYQFRRYGGRLSLLVGDEVPDAEHVVMSGQGYQQYLDRWRELAAGGVDTHRVPGDHLGVLRQPHVAGLAAILHDPTPEGTA